MEKNISLINRRFLLIFILPFILISFNSCRSEAKKGTFFSGKEFNGVDIKDLYDKNQDTKVLTLSFYEENGIAKFSKRKYYYYDCILEESYYPEIKPIILNSISAFANDDSSEISDSYTKEIYENVKEAECFILSKKEIDYIDINWEKEKFNFSGYIGIGWNDGKNYMIMMIPTKNLKKGYLFCK